MVVMVLIVATDSFPKGRYEVTIVIQMDCASVR
jgi:hypothetical protein